MSFNCVRRYLRLIVLILWLLLLPALASRLPRVADGVALAVIDPVSLIVALVLASVGSYVALESRLRRERRPPQRIRGTERTPVLPREEKDE